MEKSLTYEEFKKRKVFRSRIYLAVITVFVLIELGILISDKSVDLLDIYLIFGLAGISSIFVILLIKEFYSSYDNIKF